jgi:gamma-glutamyl:cysteine ligase YbdK (ATP-grasp superfamily)
MGTDVQTKRFHKADFTLFSQRLEENLELLGQLLERPGFGIGKPSLGAELELTLIDSKGQAQWRNQQLLALAKDPQLTLELNRYNLEYNLSPVAAAGKPFSKIAAEINRKLKGIDKLGKPFDARSVAIGILPTLGRRDISATAMTDDNRYVILSKAIKKLRHHALEVNIDGPEPLHLSVSNLNIEGANTSFQVHLRVNPAEFANLYNAAQLVTAPVLAISTNSPLFIGHRLWEETRVVLFKQSVETREQQGDHHLGPGRTGLGRSWVNSPLELFEESVRDYPVFIPECKPGDDKKVMEQGGIPKLAELRMHHGSIWHWNRAIYDPADGGHLRIEMRALPSGPTTLDMCASAALMVGLVKRLGAGMPKLTEQLPFSEAKENLYRAAQLGLTANFTWPRKIRASAGEISAPKLLKKLLPIAREGLSELKVADSEIDQYIGIIEARLAARQTGARWQLAMLTALEEHYSRKTALHHLLDRYLENVASGKPVHEWSTSC